MATKKAPPESVVIEIPEIEREELTFHMIGVTPFCYNSMDSKAQRELLFPAPKKDAAAKAATQKHEPWDEFRRSVHYAGDDAPSLLGFPASGLKKAMKTATTDIPGVAGAEIARLVRVTGYTMAMYGIPEIWSTGVRNSDMKRTPDMRTRAVLPRWAFSATVRFIRPKLNAKAITNLIVFAGETVGLGDFRQEKGAGDFGLWKVVAPDDPEYLEIVETGGREEQEAAIKNPDFYDPNTEDLLTWYEEELRRRGLK